MMNVGKTITFLCSVLLLAVMAACADQPVAPHATMDGAKAAVAGERAIGDGHAAPELPVSGSGIVRASVDPEPVLVSISGPPEIVSTGTYMWQTYATGGDGTYTYVWERRPQGGSTWTYVGSGTIYYGAVGNEPSFELRVTAYSGGLTGSTTYQVTVSIFSASITGPTSITAGTTGTWYASASGGFGSYEYRWYYRPAGSSTWTYVGDGSSYTRSVSTSSSSFYLRLTVKSSWASTSDDHYVQVQGGSGGGGGGCMDCPVMN